MSAPKALRIGGREWRIKFRRPSSMDGNLGLCHSDNGLLEIATGYGPFSTRDTLLHETFHAILHQQGRTYQEEEEELYVGALATGLIGVLQDNPEFAQWLIQSIPSVTPK